MVLSKKFSHLFLFASLFTIIAAHAQENPHDNARQPELVYLVFGPTLRARGVIVKNKTEIAQLIGFKKSLFDIPEESRESEQKTTCNSNLIRITAPLDTFPQCEAESIAQYLAYFSQEKYIAVPLTEPDAKRLSTLVAQQTNGWC